MILVFTALPVARNVTRHGLVCKGNVRKAIPGDRHVLSEHEYQQDESLGTRQRHKGDQQGQSERSDVQRRGGAALFVAHFPELLLRAGKETGAGQRNEIAHGRVEDKGQRMAPDQVGNAPKGAHG